MAHILIIDDSATQRHELKCMLEENGYQTSTAENGEQGIEVAKTLLPDLIFMDVVMPGVNGFQATRKLSQIPETCKIPVVIITTKSEQTDKVWANRQGAKGYLVKPLDKAILLESVKQVLTIA